MEYSNSNNLLDAQRHFFCSLNHIKQSYILKQEEKKKEQKYIWIIRLFILHILGITQKQKKPKTKDKWNLYKWNL